MRLLQMLPAQVMDHWDTIKACIEEALPPLVRHAPETLTRIQELLLVEAMQCWAVVADETVHHLYAIATTKVYVDECSGAKSLLIYTLTTVNAHPESIWQEGWHGLSLFARSRGCDCIVAYTADPRVLEIVQQLGGDSRTHLITVPLAA